MNSHKFSLNLNTHYQMNINTGLVKTMSAWIEDKNLGLPCSDLIRVVFEMGYWFAVNADDQGYIEISKPYII